MAGASSAAQALGLMGEGDLTADEVKRKQRELVKNNVDPVTAAMNTGASLMQTYGQAAQALLSTTPADIGAASLLAFDTLVKKPKK